MKIILNEQTVELDSAYSVGTSSIDVGMLGADSFSVMVNADVDTPSAKTFDSGVASSLVEQDLTYTAAVRNEDGDNITIAYTAGGTAGAEVVTVTDLAISVQIDDGVSTATQIKTAIDASEEALELVSVAVTGTGSTAQDITAATPLAGGEDSEVNVDDNEIVIPNHGLTLGLKGQLTSTGTLPAGLSTATDYFVIVVDTNTIKLAETLPLAKAGTAIDITNQGSSGATNTFTPTSLAGCNVKLQQSNDNSNWTDLGSATNITADGLVYLEKDKPTSRYIRIYLTLTAGHVSTSNSILIKGDR